MALSIALLGAALPLSVIAYLGGPAGRVAAALAVVSFLLVMTALVGISTYELLPYAAAAFVVESVLWVLLACHALRIARRV